MKKQRLPLFPNLQIPRESICVQPTTRSMSLIHESFEYYPEPTTGSAQPLNHYNQLESQKSARLPHAELASSFAEVTCFANSVKPSSIEEPF
jgi:hypothetical protein